jgi:hypothetical protein
MRQRQVQNVVKQTQESILYIHSMNMDFQENSESTYAVKTKGPGFCFDEGIFK